LESLARERRMSPAHLQDSGIILKDTTMVLFEETANYPSCAHCAYSPDTWQDGKAPEPRVNHGIERK
jgi:hypothetical protein